MGDKWLVQRFVVFATGTRVVSPVCVRDTKERAETRASELANDEGHLATAHLMTIDGGSAVDTGFSGADFLARVLGVRDIGFDVVRIQASELHL